MTSRTYLVSKKDHGSTIGQHLLKIFKLPSPLNTFLVVVFVRICVEINLSARKLASKSAITFLEPNAIKKTNYAALSRYLQKMAQSQQHIYGIEENRPF